MNNFMIQRSTTHATISNLPDTRDKITAEQNRL